MQLSIHFGGGSSQSFCWASMSCSESHLISSQLENSNGLVCTRLMLQFLNQSKRAVSCTARWSVCVNIFEFPHQLFLNFWPQTGDFIRWLANTGLHEEMDQSTLLNVSKHELLNYQKQILLFWSITDFKMQTEYELVQKQSFSRWKMPGTNFIFNFHHKMSFSLFSLNLLNCFG